MKAMITIATLVCICIAVKPAFSQPNSEPVNRKGEKLFSFGLIADPQYADVETKGNRYYRNSLNKLEDCIHELNSYDLAFTVTLGDLIDRDYSGFDKVLPILEKSKAKVYNVLGNHDFEVEEKYKKKVRLLLDNKKGYFDFNVGDFAFIVLDGSDLSTFGWKKGSKTYSLAMEKLQRLKSSGQNNANDWNGGFGSKQLKWLEQRLEKSSRLNKKVILFCHWPLYPENGTQLWNNQKVLKLINQYDNVIVWISGHHHTGGYHKEANIHHLTMKGMVESERETAYGIVDVYNNQLVLNGFGAQENYILEF